LPSGDQTGHQSSVGPASRGRWLVPSEFITKMSYVP